MSRRVYYIAFLVLYFGVKVGLDAKDFTATDELYQSRISSLKLSFEVTYNPVIKIYIEEYLAQPEKTRALIINSRYYFPLIERYLKSKNAPLDLKYLAANVSQFDPSSTNATGSSGMWMMAYAVSKMYKLKVTNYIDERRDLAKSSMAAAQHFKDLNSIYKNWSLAIAAYGCSPVVLNKCIRMAGNSLYFWDIYQVMPTFCRDLLPKTIATAYILNFYKEHGIKIKDGEMHVEPNDTIVVTKWLSFEQISRNLNIPIEELRFLNPTLKKDIIPYVAEGFVLKLPKGKAKDFYLLKDTFYKADPENMAFLEPIEIRKDNTRNQPASPKPDEQDVKKASLKSTKVKVTYKVKRGDNIAKIADWFDTTIPEIKKQNKLKSNQVKVGQVLSIQVPAGKKGYYQKINKMTTAQKNKLGKKD